MEETKDTARIEAFSDGVFAIAITLEIALPSSDLSRGTCQAALGYGDTKAIIGIGVLGGSRARAGSTH